MSIITPTDPKARMSRARATAEQAEERRQVRRQEQAIARWLDTFERIARALSGDRALKVRSARIETGGWNGEKIILSEAVLRQAVEARGADRLQAIGTLKGLAFHETAHAMFTPRMTQRPVKDLLDNHGWHGDTLRVLNIVEDARIERLFLGNAADARPYFVKAVTGLVLNGGPGSLHAAFPLVHGRRYLDAEDPELRSTVRELAIAHYGERKVERIAELIDEYLDLLFPAGADRAVEIVVELNHLLTDDYGVFDSDLYEIIEEVGRDAISGEEGRAVPVKVQRKAKERAEEQEAATEAAAAADEAEDEGDGTGGAEPSDSASEDAEDGSGGGAPEDAEGASTAAQEGPDGEPAGGGAGGEGASPADPEVQAADEAWDRIKDIHDRAESEVQSDASKVARAHQGEIDAEKLREISTKRKGRYTGPVSRDMRRAADRIDRVLDRLEGAMKPQWDRHRRSGSLSLDRAVRARMAKSDRVDLFDRWQPDVSHNAGAEIVIGIDSSGSMEGSMDRVGEALWVLRKAFEGHDIKVHVLTYDSRTHLVIQPGDEVSAKVYDTWAADGGTEPMPVLNYASSILAASKAPNRMLMMLTDGMWFGSPGSYAPILRELSQMGVTTHVLYFVGYLNRYSASYHRTDIAWDENTTEGVNMSRVREAIAENWLAETIGDQASSMAVTCEVINDLRGLVTAVSGDIEYTLRRVLRGAGR